MKPIRPALTFVALSLAGLPAQETIPAASTLEMRPLASEQYAEGGVRFDLAAEVERVRAWLALGENRTLLRSKPEKIRLFNWLAADRGGPLQAQLRWYPHLISPSSRNAKVWDFSFARNHGGVTAVPLFTDDEFEAGPQTPDARLVELLPVNMHAERFTQDDLDPASLKAGASPDAGTPAVYYEVRADRRPAFGNWTEKFVRQSIATIVDEIVIEAPTLMSRIEGRGVITGGFTPEQAERMVAALKQGIAPAATATTQVKGGGGGAVPAGSDPADLRAMQGAQQMLEAEKRLRDLIKAGKIEGVDRILSFEEISAWPYEDGLKGMPKQLHKLDDKNVLMTGFMLPIDEVQDIKEFLLVQSLWSCCYGQPPDINGIVRVVMKGDARIDYQFEPLKVIGTFKVKETLEDGYCVDIFQLHADLVEVIK